MEDLLKDLPDTADEDADKEREIEKDSVTPNASVADAPPSQSVAPAQEWKDEEDIKFINEDRGTRVYPRIRTASLTKLIEFLTHENYADTSLR